MPAENNTELKTINDWVMRTRAASQTPARLLLMLHGLSGDEDSMWVFTHNFPKNYWMLAPRAIHPAPQSGFTWRPLQPGSFGRPSLEELRPAAEALIALVDTFARETGVDATTFDAIGFSQGAALTNVLSFLFPHRIGKTGILAGFIPSGMESLLEAKPLTGKSVFVAHGTLDETVPIDRARASIQFLRDAGAQVTVSESAVGHKLSLEGLRGLETFLQA